MSDLLTRVNRAIVAVKIKHYDVEKILATRAIWDELVETLPARPDGDKEPLPEEPADGDMLFGLPLIVSKDIPADPGFVIVPRSDWS